MPRACRLLERLSRLGPCRRRDWGLYLCIVGTTAYWYGIICHPFGNEFRSGLHFLVRVQGPEFHAEFMPELQTSKIEDARKWSLAIAYRYL